MLVNKIFNHVESPLRAELETTTNPDGTRYYQTPDGKSYPSVTTVTGWEKRAFFAEWRRKNPEESKRVLSRGNQLHQTIEDYLNNKEGCLTESNGTDSQMFYQIVDDLHRIDNIVSLERPLWSHTLQLAGRVDCVAEFDGELSIIDFKSSTRLKRKSDIENYYLQATAYAIMFQERTKTPIKNIVILISCESGDSQVFVANPMEYVDKLHKTLVEYRKFN